jgi:putative ubiquitin-RnfH superfamily antitoxin RatB of RatAB toxin-antitoxin module
MASGAARRIVVEVAYAESGRQTLVELEVPEGTTAAQAIALSGIAAAYPHIDVGAMKTGIFGTRVPRETVLRKGDRVEIYRALITDPKEARRRRGRRRG